MAKCPGSGWRVERVGGQCACSVCGQILEVPPAGTKGCTTPHHQQPVEVPIPDFTDTKVPAA